MGDQSLLQPHELAALDRRDAEAAIRAHVQSAYLGDNTALTRILGRYKFFVDTRDHGFGSHILLDGFWEIWLTLFCARNLHTGMIAVDVGANFGYYSLMFAEFVGAPGHVIAVEPNPHAADLLRRSVDLNGFLSRTTIARVALGADDDATVPFYIPASEPKNALVVPSAASVNLDRGELIEVPSLRLDKLCTGRGAIDFVKIDAEGSEERIYAGMQEIIERDRPMIVMEFNVARYPDPGAFIEQIFGTYGTLYTINFDGSAAEVTRLQLLTERIGEDWLLVMSPQVPD